MIGTIIIVLWATSTWYFVRAWNGAKRGPRLPPGPPTIPLLGNLHVLPKAHAHIQFTEWARLYGDLLSLKLGPARTIVIISSAAGVKELMDKRSEVTADRPANYIFHQINGGINFTLARYTDTWRILRNAAHTILTPQTAVDHLPIQKAEATQLMYDILKKPQGFYNHIGRYSFSVALSVIFGKRSPRYESREATAWFDIHKRLELVLQPGSTSPVNLIPLLRYLPKRWAPWKAMAEEIKVLQRDLYLNLLKECEDRVAKGEDRGLFIEEAVKQRRELGLNREMTGCLGGILLDGAAGTTAGFLQWLIVALTVCPEAQRKAQEEIDRVVGSERMPTLDDFANLPYIQAVVREVHRFRPLAPLTIPHATLVDEEYRGYIIPKGSTIFVNLWAIFHDSRVFQDPETFNPDRFLTSENGTKPDVDDKDFRYSLVFGSGKRICPGIDLGNNLIILNTMNLIWGFDFANAIDPVTQQAIVVNPMDYEKGLLTPPSPFECSITPRSHQHTQLIEREFSESDEVFLHFEEKLDESDKAWIKQTRSH